MESPTHPATNTADFVLDEHDPRHEYTVLNTPGEFIGGGISGIVQLYKGNAVKSPWPGRQYADCREDLTFEAKMYGILGEHQRLVKILKWDPKECMITMEYMPNGTLLDYLAEHNHEITTEQRLQWIEDIAEGLQLLHSADIIYCDIKPKNMLLDSNFRIKLVDFGSSSYQGSKPTGCAGTRYMPPGSYSAFSKRIDIFGLGSTIYKVMTGNDPFHDIPSGEVWPRFSENDFPDVSNLRCGEIIHSCWLGKYQSAQEVHDAVKIESRERSRS